MLMAIYRFYAGYKFGSQIGSESIRERVKFSGEGRTPKLLISRMSKCKGVGSNVESNDISR